MPKSSHSIAMLLPFPGKDGRQAPLQRVRLADRRIKFRYPVDLSVRFRLLRPTNPFSGVGVAVNLSSGGILVVSEHEFDVGALVEMSIEWPALLDGRIPLQLLASGQVLRSEKSSFAVSFQRHEFRTMGSSTLKPDTALRPHLVV